MVVTLLMDQTIENTFYLAGVVVNFPVGGFDPSPLLASGLASVDVTDGSPVILHVDSRPAD